MAVVQGIREQIHGPVYDALKVPPGKQLREVEPTSTLRFFVNVQNKTKLETNLQSAALLPHYNTFEARAMRVVISDLPPEFSDKVDVVFEGVMNVDTGSTNSPHFKTDLQRASELLDEARSDQEGKITIHVGKDGKEVESDASDVRTFDLAIRDLEAVIENVERGQGPPFVQLRPNNGAGTIIGKFIYNTVTTLYVGEKIMIQMPTWFFPGGAGPFSEAAHFTTHGQPDPMATFRFAEPVFIDKQQNFRVEIEVPDKDVLEELHRLYGPLFIWVVLDGFMTRDVQ